MRPVPTRPALALLALATAMLTGCSSGTETVADDDPVVQVPSSAPSVVATPSPTAPAVRVVTAEYRGGDVVVDSSRVETEVGEQIVLRIASDVAEEIHVHGYDEFVDVPPGGSVDIPLTLTLPGSYEVELHKAGRPLFQLRTS